MGSVPDLVTTGDNDPEIYPVQYYRHYLYCDECGSFELDPWVEPENHRQIEKIQKRLNQVAIVSLIAAIVSTILAFLGMPILLLFSLIVLIGSAGAAAILGSRIRDLGVRCKQCQTTYAFGSPLFKATAENPRQYTMADVPRPLYRNYWVRGETVGRVDDEI